MKFWPHVVSIKGGRHSAQGLGSKSSKQKRARDLVRHDGEAWDLRGPRGAGAAFRIPMVPGAGGDRGQGTRTAGFTPSRAAAEAEVSVLLLLRGQP